MNALCVYCGSHAGRNTAYVDAARNLGRTLADRDVALVFGGGQVGMMGAVANATLDAGGDAYGVIPAALAEREHAHDGVTDLEIVDSMHERKARMADLADGFVALPGGFGTLEEIVEVVTWAQLGFHSDPCGFLNVAGYFDDLLAFFDHQNAEGFVSDDNREMLVVADDPDELLNAYEAYRPPGVTEYITDEDET